MLLILSVLSMGVGNFAAIAQTNLKRMLAYSAISHMGFMLLGLVTGVVGGDARFALNAYSSSMFYVVTYVLTSAGTFGMILLLSRAGFESDEIQEALSWLDGLAESASSVASKAAVASERMSSRSPIVAARRIWGFSSAAMASSFGPTRSRVGGVCSSNVPLRVGLRGRMPAATSR